MAAKTKVIMRFNRKLIEGYAEHGSRNMRMVMEEYAKDLRQKLDVPPERTGARVRVGGKVIRASAPGEPPAPRTGRLRDSIKTQVNEDRMLQRFKGSVYSDVPYAAALELGTKNMAARPAWIPTLEENKAKYAKIATQGMGSAETPQGTGPVEKG